MSRLAIHQHRPQDQDQILNKEFTSWPEQTEQVQQADNIAQGSTMYEKQGECDIDDI